jgi:hypothetical protein
MDIQKIKQQLDNFNKQNKMVCVVTKKTQGDATLIKTQMIVGKDTPTIIMSRMKSDHVKDMFKHLNGSLILEEFESTTPDVRTEVFNQLENMKDVDKVFIIVNSSHIGEVEGEWELGEETIQNRLMNFEV